MKDINGHATTRGRVMAGAEEMLHDFVTGNKNEKDMELW